MLLKALLQLHSSHGRRRELSSKSKSAGTNRKTYDEKFTFGAICRLPLCQYRAPFPLPSNFLLIQSLCHKRSQLSLSSESTCLPVPIATRRWVYIFFFLIVLTTLPLAQLQQHSGTAHCYLEFADVMCVFWWQKRLLNGWDWKQNELPLDWQGKGEGWQLDERLSFKG